MEYKTSDGSLYQKWTYEYDKIGNRVIGFEGFNDGVVVKKISPVCAYDDMNNFTKVTYYHDSTNSQKYKVLKFNKGIQLMESQYDTDGFLSDLTINIYDVKGNLIQEERRTYKSNGSFDVEIHKKNEYDKRGNLIVMYRYSEGKIDDKHTYKYDKKANKIASKFYRNESNDQMAIKFHGYADTERLIFNNTFKYDKRGNQITENRFKDDGSLNYKITSEYIFDKNGNWIEKKEYYDSEYHKKSPHGITKRIFEYSKDKK